VVLGASKNNILDGLLIFNILTCTWVNSSVPYIPIQLILKVLKSILYSLFSSKYVYKCTIGIVYLNRTHTTVNNGLLNNKIQIV